MSLVSKKRTAKEILENKEFRHSYVWENIKRSIPFQIRTMRTERDWSQAKAGEILGKPQNVISRLESPAYSKLTLQTLIEIAQGFDVGIIIKFVPFSRFLNEYDDVSFEALSAPSPTDSKEIEAIWSWAKETGNNDITFTEENEGLQGKEQGQKKSQNIRREANASQSNLSKNDSTRKKLNDFMNPSKEKKKSSYEQILGSSNKRQNFEKV